MTISKDLSGRNAIVTGGASGLGRAIANRLAASGANITIVTYHEPMPKNSLSRLLMTLGRLTY
jgi:3-oxoacyl-[acyl-carrier protein] reductase